MNTNSNKIMVFATNSISEIEKKLMSSFIINHDEILHYNINYKDVDYGVPTVYSSISLKQMIVLFDVNNFE